MQDISNFFAKIASFFHLDEVVGYGELVLLPTTVYFHNDVQFVASSAEFNAMVTDYTKRLKEMGACDTTFEILSQEPLRNDGIRAEVVWSHNDKHGNAVLSTKVSYFCRADNGSWKIALIEYSDKPNEVLNAIKTEN